MTEKAESQTHRLVELDALRGIAAALVMLFHYTTRYEELYGHDSTPIFSLPWGHYGVNLFFMISGFVIFMTLHRVKRPLDFIASRFSRLFPAFWVAVILTFILTRALDLPDKAVGLGTAAMNLFMIHGLLGIPHVDGVYWTLEIELLFYGMALTLYLLGRLDKVHVALLSLIGFRLVYFLTHKLAGIDLSWTLSRLLILPYIAWFVCGIMIYRLVTFPKESPRKDAIVLAIAIIQLAAVEGVGIGLLAASLSALLWAAASGKLRVLANPLLAWLGTISYTLYLLHENIGWGVILHAERAGLPANLAMALAIAVALVLATTVTYVVERPAMNWLRNRYRDSHPPPFNMRRIVATISLLLAAFAALGLTWRKTHPAPERPGDRVAHAFRPTALMPTPCLFTEEPKPLMVLVLGQSNAGNHGELSATADSASEQTSFFFDGECFQTAGPAPGATGLGGNLWTSLGPSVTRVTGRRVVFSVLAVEGTRIRDWVEPGKLRETLIDTIGSQRRHGFIPDIVLWQQGEADARAGTTRTKYLERFKELVANLRATGIAAPISVALSTRCRNEGSEAVRAALRAAAATDPTVRVGPDTDTLTGSSRRDDCHFSASGQRSAAELWLDALHEPLRAEAGHALLSSSHGAP